MAEGCRSAPIAFYREPAPDENIAVPTLAGGSREHREPGLSNRNCRY